MSSAAPMQRALGLCALVLLALTLQPKRSSAEQSPLPTNSKIVFLHHSTGSIVWNGGVPGWFDTYNAANGTAYVISQLAYPDTPYPWANYPYDFWNLWVNHAGATPYDGQATLEILTTQYQVIVFKHCFPVSSIYADTGSPDIASNVQTIENYKLQYAALKAKMRSFPSNRFILWTGAALLQSNTPAEHAARAKEFFDWVVNVWDEPGDNIFVWDFFGLETDGGMYMTPEHGSSDSHPNPTFAAEVAPLLGQRIVDVIQGRADTTGVTQVQEPGGELSLALAGANPATGPVRLRFALPVAAHVELSIHDATGRRVALLFAGDSPAGARVLTWDRRPGGVASGVYFARLRAGERVISRRIVILD